MKSRVRKGVLLTVAMLLTAAVLDSIVLSIVVRPANGQSVPQTSQSGAQAAWERADKAMQRKEYSTALKLLMPLAEQGDARAQSYLGFIYEKGYSVPRNLTEAAKWYRFAANQGEAEAQSSLGNLYEHGSGVPKDMKEANRLFRLAADQNEGIAQYGLGVSYGTGMVFSLMMFGPTCG